MFFHGKKFDLNNYGDAGYFLKKHPKTNKYKYANWGSRRWEYFYVENLLNKLNIKYKTVVDIGIGRPEDSNFYEYYINSGCTLIGIDPDTRLNDVTSLSESCKILRKSAETTDLESNSIDIVVALSSLEHIPVTSLKKSLTEIYRILKNDGIFIVTLDMTIDKEKPACWAILEKTYNGYPAEENDNTLLKNDKQITIESFIELASEHFYIKNKSIVNKVTSPFTYKKYVCNEQWNSIVGYIVFNKLIKK